MRLTMILTGVLLGIVCLTGVMYWYADAAVTYSVTGFDENATENITKGLDEINSIAIETKDRIENVKANPLIPDTLGVVLVGGIGALKTMLGSIDVLIDVSFASADLLPLGDMQDVIVGFVVTVLIIVFFVGIFAHYIRPSDRL